MAEIEIDRREWLKVAGLLGLSAGLAGVGCAPANSGQPTTTWPTTTTRSAVSRKTRRQS